MGFFLILAGICQLFNGYLFTGIFLVLAGVAAP